MKKPLLAAVALGLMATACGPKTPELTSGVDMANLDTTANPATDFYQYACGGWMASHPLDDEHSRYGAFDVLGENCQKQINTLIDSIAKAQNEKGSIAEKIATFYNLGMDSVTLQKQGAEPIMPYIKEIAALNGRGAFAKEVANLQKLGFTPFFGIFAEPDAVDASKNIAWVYQGGIGMEERDYYLEKENAPLRESYVAMMTANIANSGYDKLAGLPADQLAKMVMGLETRLAKAQYDNLRNREPKEIYHIYTLEQADKEAKAVDFRSYFATMGLPNLTTFNMCQPSYIQEVAKVLATENESTVKAYLAWCVINDAAPYLSDDFVNARFEFFGKALGGKQANSPRWKRVTRTVDGSMGEAMGQMYVAKYFPAEAKERMITLVSNLQEAFAMRIEAAEWMGPETKAKALDKLSSIMVKVGYPDTWRDYSGLDIKGDSYFANIVRSNAFEMAYTVGKVDKPVDRTEWGMTPQTVNAYYNPSTNEICFPAGILQPPFFNLKADDAVNYGAIGVVIGHEMTHGFDNHGRQYDKVGNLSNWWTDEDTANFNQHAQVLVDCFNKVKVLDNPVLYANGKLSLGENIADNGGLHISYQAMLNAIAKKQVNDQPMDGFTPAQRFFLSYASVWAGNIRDEEIRQRTVSDVHSLGRNRVNVTLPHIAEFLEAWGVKEGDAMWLAPENRVVLW